MMLARALFVAALLSASGSLVFRVLIAPRALAGIASDQTAPVERALSRLTWISLVAAVPGMVGWAVLQAGVISSAEDLSQTVSALQPVLTGTRFGHLIVLQLGLVAATSCLIAGRADRLAAIAATANVAAQAGHGHAMAMHGASSLLFGADVLHLLSAAFWVGGLMPLLLVVRLGPPRAGATAARWFSPLGKWAVVLLAGSALLQGWVLVGSVAALRAMPYGIVVLVKTALFGGLLGCALLNRYRLAPDLLGGSAEAARQRLAGSIIVQATFGVLAIAAAAMLSGLTPGMDMHAGMS